MTILEFPPVEEADEYGLLAIGGDTEVESLLLAYQSGIFLWPLENSLLTWFAPPKRAILFLQQVHYPRSLLKEVARANFDIRISSDFRQVISECAAASNRSGDGEGTWITPEMISSYTELHRAGFAESIEAYRDGELVGGLYGVCIGGMFAAESMFYAVNNASKVCLHFLIEYLRERQVPWIDFQVINPFTKGLGTVEIDRADFMEMLADEIARPVKLFHSQITT